MPYAPGAGRLFFLGDVSQAAKDAKPVLAVAKASCRKDGARLLHIITREGQAHLLAARRSDARGAARG